MKKIAFIFCLCLSVIHLFAGEREGDFKTNKNVLSLSGSLFAYGSEPALGLEVSYIRYIGKYIGVMTGLAFQNWIDNDYKPNTEVSDGKGQKYTLYDDGKLLRGNWLIGPNFRTPSVSLGRERDYQLFLQCEPALILTLPNEAFSYAHYTEEGGKIKGEFRSVRNKGGDVVFWRVKSALSLGIDQLAFSLGYTISNQDPYSSRRNVCFDGHKISPSRGTYKFLHECSVSLSYSF